eukprot:TRINITY_DN3456_c0_g1_i2.p1 TRINITY_DN3456_c0_g1~~TRINITY_DN3456_c0_g1_i2.p1  ORF type:complete len:179 (-),score=50.46 TRINITY_DN3456_c0_g1_i2:234-713(-)
MAVVSNLHASPSSWRCAGVPIEAMMAMNTWATSWAGGAIGAPTVAPFKVNLKGRAYLSLQQQAKEWLVDDLYRNPGPLQFEGPGSDARTLTLTLDRPDFEGNLLTLKEYLRKVAETVKEDSPPEALHIALASMGSFASLLASMCPPLPAAVSSKGAMQV